MNKRVLFIIIALFILLGVGAAFLFYNRSIPASNLQPASQSQNKTYTLSEISTHKDASSCWTVIDGKVYDLTSWIDQHPGGSENILSVCGMDGSAAFNNQHAGQPRPESELKNFYIGNLQ